MSRKDHPEERGVRYSAHRRRCGQSAGGVRYSDRCTETPQEWVKRFGWHEGGLVPRALLQTVWDEEAQRWEYYAVITSMPKGLSSATTGTDWTPRSSEDTEVQKSWDRLPADRHDSEETTSFREAEAELREL